MKDVLLGYINYSDEEQKNIWGNSIIIFDTNVILNLYRHPEAARENLMETIKKAGSRIWMPNKVALEFGKNRCRIIEERKDKYEKIAKKMSEDIEEYYSSLKLEKNCKEII